MLGISVNTIAKATGIDRWFIYEIQKICNMEKELAKYKIETIPDATLQQAKTLGFSDDQIVHIMNSGTEDALYEKRKAAGITRTAWVSPVGAKESPATPSHSFYPSYNWSVFAAIIKSLRCSPPILCVHHVTVVLPHSVKRAG